MQNPRAREKKNETRTGTAFDDTTNVTACYEVYIEAGFQPSSFVYRRTREIYSTTEPSVWYTKHLE